MTTQELNGANVKLSRSTITVKGENGKTQGMIRGLRRYKDTPNNVQFELFKILKKSGIWGNNAASLDCLYLDGNRLFYLYNTQPDEHYIKYNLSQFDEDKKRYEARQKLLKDLEECKEISVVRCIIL